MAAIYCASVLAVSYVVAHITVIVICRLYFHPFVKDSGPFLAKTTGLYGAYYAYTGDMHLDIERCHKQYGESVRYRPRRILVNSPETEN
ncbi:uncharacterized protein L3040_004453 [Drepanopeziza brunnea f. sp. 'multigermtubi']|uniref:uncharacterized protein n=1 Tax=Drepanopeziza brunnea f. sp. 'multigermtubi' TaxID=698441 RepID=UPI002394C37B|nr:hypothetical protein L3040_004453 [Drepanopeziza brunnea f. sp. 'multigermtubi']